MNWIKLEQLLLKPVPARAISHAPALEHAQLCEQALSVAAGLQARGVKRLAVHLEDAAELAIALLGAWRAGVSVLLPSDLQAQTRQRWSGEVDLWLTEQIGDSCLADFHEPALPGAERLVPGPLLCGTIEWIRPDLSLRCRIWPGGRSGFPAGGWPG